MQKHFRRHIISPWIKFTGNLLSSLGSVTFLYCIEVVGRRSALMVGLKRIRLRIGICIDVKVQVSFVICLSCLCICLQSQAACQLCFFSRSLKLSKIVKYVIVRNVRIRGFFLFYIILNLMFFNSVGRTKQAI